MHRDPFTDPYPDRSDLAILNPDARFSRDLVPIDAELFEQINQEIFQTSQVTVQVPAALAQIENRVTHQLTGSVVGCLTAPIGFEERMGELGNDAQARLIRKPSDRINRLVLEQDDAFFAIVEATTERFFLNLKSNLIIDPA